MDFLMRKDRIFFLEKLVISWIKLLGSYFILLAIISTGIFAFLHKDVAEDVLFPYYLSKSYTYVRPEYRYPYYAGMDLLIKTELPMAIGAAGAAIISLNFILGHNFQCRPNNKQLPIQLILPPLYFLVASFVFIKHAWHFYQYGIYVAFGCAVLFNSRSTLARNTTLLALLLYPLFFIAQILHHHTKNRQLSTTEYLKCPSGDVLEGPSNLVQFYNRLFQAINKEIASSNGSRSIAVFIDRPGIYKFGDFEVSGRICWYYPGYLRSWEKDSERYALLNSGAIIVGSRLDSKGPNRNAALESLAMYLPSDLKTSLETRLTNPIYVGIDPSEQTAVWAYAVIPSLDK